MTPKIVSEMTYNVGH